MRDDKTQTESYTDEYGQVHAPTHDCLCATPSQLQFGIKDLVLRVRARPCRARRASAVADRVA